ncbi:MAG: ribonuclease P protein component [Janthinobacterium lividum]
MLAQAARMRSSQEFRETARRGARSGRPTVVVHALDSARSSAGSSPTSPFDGVHVGFVVSKAVGNAVTRNRVKRRLRHLAAVALVDVPPGTRLVVRALPRAATHADELASDLDQAWRRSLRRLADQHRPGAAGVRA